MLTVRGKIRFSGNSAPESLPKGSTLTVKFQDTSRMDAAAITLGKQVIKIDDYEKGKDLCFEIKDAKSPAPYPEATMSAVLNVGWAASGDEWIRQGDYLNDTTHHVKIESGKTIYEGCDVEVVHYT